MRRFDLTDRRIHRPSRSGRPLYFAFCFVVVVHSVASAMVYAQPLNGPQPSGSILEDIVNTELRAISVELQKQPIHLRNLYSSMP